MLGINLKRQLLMTFQGELEEFCSWLDENNELTCFRKELLILLASEAAQKW